MIVRRRERSDRAPSSGRSERSERDTSANGGSGATVRNHRQGASGASVIEPQIGNKQVVKSVQSAERKAEHGPRGRARL